MLVDELNFVPWSPIFCTVEPDILYCGAQYFVLWNPIFPVLTMELVPCHLSGAQNVEVAKRFLENLCISSYRVWIKSLIWSVFQTQQASFTSLTVGCLFPAWPISAGPALRPKLCQRRVLRSLSGSLNNRWGELVRRQQWQWPFRKFNKNSLERWTGAYRSGREKIHLLHGAESFLTS
jgi:hypothetical protein